jgi:hypothetical protein
MANIHSGELRRWDSLTKEQQESGEWIKVPDGTEGGHARPRTFIDDIPQRRLEDAVAELSTELRRQRSPNGDKR